MEFPIIGIAYTATKQGDAVVKEEILNDEMDQLNFLNRYSSKSQIKYQKIKNENTMSILNKAPQSHFLFFTESPSQALC